MCELELVGIAVVGSAPDRRLTPTGGDPVVVVHLPVQHIAEEVFPAVDPPHGFGKPIASRAAGPSRVAFRVDPAAFPIDYKLGALLEVLAKSDLAVSPSAARGPKPAGCLNFAAVLQYMLNPPGLAPPAATETAIELPFRLILSPDGESGFAHQASPVSGLGSTRTELWHSLLEPAPDKSDQREVRAVWLRQGTGPPWNPSQPKWDQSVDNGEKEPFPVNTMSQRNRADIVHLSGNRRYALQTGTLYEATAIAVRRLGLSALGSWLDLRGEWEPPALITPLVGWAHRATQGRDHFVRIVEQGFLYPFGHRAVRVQISERRFVEPEPPAGDPPVLLKREFIIVRAPVKQFEPGAAPGGKAHTMPLREVRIKTLVTPDIKPAGDCALITEVGKTEPFQFKLTATDVEGNRVDFASPLVWVISDLAWTVTTVNDAKSKYGTRDLDTHGAPVALAKGSNDPATNQSRQDATFPAQTLAFSAEPWSPMPQPKGPPEDHQPGFWPELTTAEVKAPALEIVAGQGGTAKVGYHKAFVDHGTGGANAHELIAALKGGTLPLDFADKGDRAGGLIQPSMAVSGLSRRLGPAAGSKLDELAAGKFSPADFFAGAAPKLFGVFTLDQVLATITGSLPTEVPRIVTEGASEALAAKQVWNPVPQSYPTTDPIFVVDQNKTKVEIVASFDARSAEPQAEVSSKISDFWLHLLGKPTFLKIHFEHISFEAKTGRKPDVDVQMGEVVFAGPLSFIEELKELIPLDGFSDPPALEVTPEGVRSSFSLAVPDVAVGVFALQNLSLGAGFAIPFTDGALTVTFNFCTRAEPFLLTVSLFGGGGFFGLAIDPHGVQMLEASLEFGASASINLGVAQGGVHVMAGIYFKIESAKGCTLTGYLRLGGEMSVLGLISASIELNLSFTYKDVGKAYGRAVITVEIDIFLFSMSVEVECERQFAGSANDPPFQALMGVDPWHEYCEAYA